METFWNWLIGEAGGAWIGFLVLFAWGVYTWRRGEKPPRIVVEEIDELRLLDIHPVQRDQLEVRYKKGDGASVRIRNLTQNSLPDMGS